MELHGFRNYAWMAKQHFGESTFAFVLRLLMTAAATALCDDHPALRLRWLLRFAIQGRTGRSGTSRRTNGETSSLKGCPQLASDRKGDRQDRRCG
jgi:hypothetical protein